MTRRITSQAHAAAYRTALKRAQRYAGERCEPVAVLQNERDRREFLVASYDAAVNLTYARLLDIVDEEATQHEQDYLQP